eukprot:TRINITY_DN11116_c0_g1_i1.p2 TRINITY_DN11116_c0_g1~~TRINITY_DN11116_c0_g1_i1.p2  ORF type:complete len:111 (-),score=35.79 TRINITY_DN11116_c0_g1_i1:87-419(-)
MIRRPPRSTQGVSSAASDVYKRQDMQWAKKQGAGSKGTWGKPGDELVKNAPMYDSDEEDSEAMQAKFTEEIKMKMHADRLVAEEFEPIICLLYTSPSPRDLSTSRMPSSA